MVLIDKYYRPDEVAEILGISKRTVYRMIKSKRIIGIRDILWWKGKYGPWRIPLGDFIYLLEAKK